MNKVGVNVLQVYLLLLKKLNDLLELIFWDLRSNVLLLLLLHLFTIVLLFLDDLMLNLLANYVGHHVVRKRHHCLLL